MAGKLQPSCPSAFIPLLLARCSARRGEDAQTLNSHVLGWTLGLSRSRHPHRTGASAGHGLGPEQGHVSL